MPITVTRIVSQYGTAYTISIGQATFQTSSDGQTWFWYGRTVRTLGPLLGLMLDMVIATARLFGLVKPGRDFTAEALAEEWARFHSGDEKTHIVPTKAERF